MKGGGRREEEREGVGGREGRGYIYTYIYRKEGGMKGGGRREGGREGRGAGMCTYI